MRNDKNTRLYSRYSIEWAAEHAHSHFKHFSGNDYGFDALSQEEASCELRNRVIDRQNTADQTELRYFDDMQQKKPEIRFDFIHDEAMIEFQKYHERKWFLDEVQRIQDELDEESDSPL